MKTYNDLTGDGGSGVLEQVIEQRRALAASLAGVRRLLAVASGKGGVGKSTVTMGLALELARRGRRVAVLDADLNGPSLARMGGLEVASWAPDEEGRLRLPRRADGVGVVSLGSVLAEADPLRFASQARGDEHTWRATREMTLFAQLLTAVEWGALDLLLFDLPPGADRTRHFASFLGRRLALVLVTLPSAVARGVVARSRRAIEETGNPLLGEIENMAGYLCPECEEVRPLFPATAAAGTPRPLATIPFDPRLAALCDRGLPPGLELDRALAPFAPLAEALVPLLEEVA